MRDMYCYIVIFRALPWRPRTAFTLEIAVYRASFNRASDVHGTYYDYIVFY